MRADSAGERRYAQRLGLLDDTDAAHDASEQIHHFGNPGDVIFMGTCQLCWLFDYALETHCHVGNVCLYNFTGTPNVNLHRMSVVMERFLTVDPPPPCAPEVNCTECDAWATA